MSSDCSLNLSSPGFEHFSDNWLTQTALLPPMSSLPPPSPFSFPPSFFPRSSRELPFHIFPNALGPSMQMQENKISPKRENDIRFGSNNNNRTAEVATSVVIVLLEAEH